MIEGAGHLTLPARKALFDIRLDHAGTWDDEWLLRNRLFGGGQSRASLCTVIVVRKMTNLSITLDHRIVDGATAARFLNEMIRLLETPGLMLLEDV